MTVMKFIFQDEGEDMYLDTYDSGNDEEDEKDHNPHLEDLETEYVDQLFLVHRMQESNEVKKKILEKVDLVCLRVVS